MMNANFYCGRKIFIAGASGGLGKALVEELCALQVSSLILSARREEVLAHLAQQAQRHGVDCEIYPADCSLEQELYRALDSGLKQGCSVFILAMGVVPPHGRDSLEDLGAVAKVFAVNTQAPLQAVYYLSSRLPSGSIIGVISSQAACYPIPSLPLYGASKSALSYALRALMPYFRQRNIKLTLIEPGFFDSPMGRRFHGRTWFKLSAHKAARKVLSSLASGKTHAIFPWQLRFAIALLPWLPRPLREGALRFFAFDTIPKSKEDIPKRP